MGMAMLRIVFYLKHLYLHWAKMPHEAGDKTQWDTQGRRK